MSHTEAHISGRGTRAVQSVFLALFLFFLAAPALQERTQLFSYEAVVENRVRAPRPAGILGIFNSESGYAHKYEAYFNDNYGFRDFLIKLKNQLDMWLFSTSDEVLIGEDGWLFYRKLYERDMRRLESSASLMPTIVERLSRLNALLAQRGVKLVVVPCPAKTTLYRERVPADYPVPADHTAFQQYRALLRKHPEIAVVDVQGILEQLKPRMRTYHKTDFHWTDPAGAIVWKDLHKLLAAASGQREPSLARVSTSKRPGFAGGEINSLAVFFPPTETGLELKVPLSNPDGTFEPSKDPNRWTYVAKNPSDPGLLPATVLIGDSFADAFLRAGFAAPFSRLSKFSNNDFASTALNLPEGTRFLVFEHIESLLLAMTNDVWWPRELLDGESAGKSGGAAS